jgi:hypothetical protein
LGVALTLVAILAGQAVAQSVVQYSTELGGDNHAANWKAGTRTLYTRGSSANGLTFYNGNLLNYAVVLTASGIHSQTGHPSNGYEIFGAANSVFNLELYSKAQDGTLTLATGAVFKSTINDGTNGDPTCNAAFALSFAPFGTPGRLIDTASNGGPRMEPIFTYPTAQPGKLIGQGAGYKEWNRTGNLTVMTLAGVGMDSMPNGTGGHTAGLGAVPIAEGQVDVSTLVPGTYVLKVIAGNGNNVLRGDLNMIAAVNRPAFAVAANSTPAATQEFILSDQPPCSGVRGRFVYYNNSYFDGKTPGITAGDFNAIATDKAPLLPGGGQTKFVNYISYEKGINGLIIDACHFNRLPVVDVDIYFALSPVDPNTGNALQAPGDPTYWYDYVPPPTDMQLFPGQGVNGSDRLVMVWPDNTVPNSRWLLVGLLAGDPTFGIPADDYFVFGLAIGEGSKDFLVNPTDEILARQNIRTPGNPAPVDFLYDYNRDHLCDPKDQILSRGKRTTPANKLPSFSW